jgi:hypothetical protein
MTSQINPNNIDGEYPVAGQDNNTLGFRNNFTNIKVNFQFAETEITNLQANSISRVSTSVNEFNNSIIYGARLQNVSYIKNNQGNVANVATLDYTTGSFQSITPTANTTLQIPSSGNSAAIMTLAINATAANSLSEPFHLTIANVENSSSGVIGYDSNTNKLYFPRTNSTVAGTHTYQLTTNNGWSSFTMTPISTLTTPLNASAENVANAAVINLGVSDSYFSTTAAETATLPAGVNGQVKVLALYADMDDSSLDNMVITVTNAGWKTSGTGTITFDSRGDACTLKYINSKWFCIGNNGAVFA